MRDAVVVVLAATIIAKRAHVHPSVIDFPRMPKDLQVS